MACAQPNDNLKNSTQHFVDPFVTDSFGRAREIWMEASARVGKQGSASDCFKVYYDAGVDVAATSTRMDIDQKP